MAGKMLFLKGSLSELCLMVVVPGGSIGKALEISVKGLVSIPSLDTFSLTSKISNLYNIIPVSKPIHTCTQTIILFINLIYLFIAFFFGREREAARTHGAIVHVTEVSRVFYGPSVNTDEVPLEDSHGG